MPFLCGPLRSSSALCSCYQGLIIRNAAAQGESVETAKDRPADMRGVGDFGPAARAFVDFLAASKQKLWQVLPLSPTGYGSSPYSALSIGLCL